MLRYYSFPTSNPSLAEVKFTDSVVNSFETNFRNATKCLTTMTESNEEIDHLGVLDLIRMATHLVPYKRLPPEILLSFPMFCSDFAKLMILNQVYYAFPPLVSF